MMGHRERLSGGDEFDGLRRRSKKYFNWKPGERQRIKRKFNKRVRRDNKADARRSGE